MKEVTRNEQTKITKNQISHKKFDEKANVLGREREKERQSEKEKVNETEEQTK